jgi:hypothetical protein
MESCANIFTATAMRCTIWRRCRTLPSQVLAQRQRMVPVISTVIWLQQDGVIAGAIVGLGGLGVVTKMTLDVVPEFQMSQSVYENLPLVHLKEHFDDIFGSSYSVSLFTDWKQAMFNQVWIKRKITDQASAQVEPELFIQPPFPSIAIRSSIR